MVSEFPRRARTPDWFLRVREVSPLHYEVVACDRWGRQIEVSGGEEDLERMIEDCERYAEKTRAGC